MVILLFGPPGCGKGTQAAFISRLLGIPSISTGEMFRAEREAGTPLGRQVSQILSQGGLVGDEIVNEIVARRIARPDCRAGFLLDGYPRTIPQASFLDGVLQETRRFMPTILHLDVPDSVLVTRITARRQCPVCGHIYNVLHQPPRVEGVCDADGASLVRREDDTEEVIRARLKAYQESTGPLLDYYSKRNFHRIDGNRSLEEIHRDIEQTLLPALAEMTEAIRSEDPVCAHRGG
jgi:adenylate kinase